MSVHVVFFSVFFDMYVHVVFSVNHRTVYLYLWLILIV